MIAVHKVQKQFDGVTALRGVTLTIERGSRVAFVGSNGSGKTTLLRSILGLLRFEGTITIDGVDVSKAPEVALRTVAYVPQIAPPLDVRSRELVEAHAKLRGFDPSETWACAKRLGLDTDLALGKRFRDLSGGMKQKLLAAMALATQAPILICDEPTANLDGDARASFFEQLTERSEATVILCSHRLEEVERLVNRVVEFREGSVLRDHLLATPVQEAP